MNIFDNVLSESDAIKIENLLLSQDFPWFLIKKSSGESKKIKGFTDTLQFEHNFIRDSEIKSNLIHEIMTLLNWEDIINKTNISPFIFRMKSNLLLKTQSTPNTPHIDFNFPHTVLLYYVNDSSGSTIFYDNKLDVIKKVVPKRGSVVVFDGSIYHSSTPPITNDYRCVINFNIKNNLN
jgi:hypothetical protein